MEKRERYYCGEVKDVSDGDIFCGEFVCDNCEDEVAGDTTGYCSCECQLSGNCDQTC